MNQSKRIIEMHTDLKWIKKQLFGNGAKGLVSKVASNTRWRLITTGGLTLLSFLIGWVLIVAF